MTDQQPWRVEYTSASGNETHTSDWSAKANAIDDIRDLTGLPTRTGEYRILFEGQVRHTILVEPRFGAEVDSRRVSRQRDVRELDTSTVPDSTPLRQGWKINVMQGVAVPRFVGSIVAATREEAVELAALLVVEEEQQRTARVIAPGTGASTDELAGTNRYLIHADLLKGTQVPGFHTPEFTKALDTLAARGATPNFAL